MKRSILLLYVYKCSSSAVASTCCFFCCCCVVLGALLLDLLLTLDHDHGQEGEDDGQSKDQKHTGDADRIFTAREVIVQEVRLVDKGLHY